VQVILGAERSVLAASNEIQEALDSAQVVGAIQAQTDGLRESRTFDANHLRIQEKASQTITDALNDCNERMTGTLELIYPTLEEAMGKVTELGGGPSFGDGWWSDFRMGVAPLEKSPPPPPFFPQGGRINTDRHQSPGAATVTATAAAATTATDTA
jgi:hypothetical protein